MLWEELTAKQFPISVRETRGVCLLPIGVLEKHGNHLPVGTDMFTAQALCKKAAETEASVVFPYYFLGQIAEARHYPGCISASHRLLMDTLLEMCDEIHRNGFHKIIIVSSHGGNGYFLPFFVQEMPRLGKSYNVYTWFCGQMKEQQREIICELAKTEELGAHAGLSETSVMMHLRPELVRMENVNPGESKAQGRLAQLKENGVITGFSWYADYPYHFAGDPRTASAELGKVIFDIMCGNLVEIIRAVKADDASEKMIKEFKKNCSASQPLN
jgi:creatinine amidohydrolase